MHVWVNAAHVLQQYFQGSLHALRWMAMLMYTDVNFAEITSKLANTFNKQTAKEVGMIHELPYLWMTGIHYVLQNSAGLYFLLNLPNLYTKYESILVSTSSSDCLQWGPWSTSFFYLDGCQVHTCTLFPVFNFNDVNQAVISSCWIHTNTKHQVFTCTLSERPVNT